MEMSRELPDRLAGRAHFISDKSDQIHSLLCRGGQATIPNDILNVIRGQQWPAAGISCFAYAVGESGPLHLSKVVSLRVES